MDENINSTSIQQQQQQQLQQNVTVTTAEANVTASTSSSTTVENSTVVDGSNNAQQQQQQQQLNDLHIEANRLATFQNWPNPNISPQSLAKAGFYYLNREDEVQCAWCNCVFAKWEKCDNAFEEHKRFFPDCPKVQLGPLIETASYGIRDLGIHQISPSRRPEYSSLDARLRTYANWPIRWTQLPEALAQAGLYYTDVDDQVRCFHCNIGLHSWEKNDEPWFEHAKWYPQCGFVILVKGEGYVREVLEKTRRQTQIKESVISINEAMATPIVLKALEMGINVKHLRKVTYKRLLTIGRPYDTVEELMNAVFDNREIENENVNDDDDDDDDDEAACLPGTSTHSSNTNNTTSSNCTNRDRNIINELIAHYAAAHNDDDDDDDDNDDIDVYAQQQQQQQQQKTNNISNKIFNRAQVAEVTIQTDNMKQPTLSGNVGGVGGGCDAAAAIVDAAAAVAAAVVINEQTTSERAKLSPIRCLSLEEENRKLKDARLCKVCLDEEVGVVFLPCGHLVTCVQCAPGIGQCPMCRSGIKGFVRTYLS